ncbi:DMT family transporter [Gryllotalpicola protaetiae]|uniref:DMT family transporter n=1 Tax=Gryllotalpicola protaetiae TaxID=2419771 RepID=A0A387BNH1_9MICO|nr:DMT family transporter [Gryllotalpicola protaetiae]AYG03992.1 DMT family transporter [Gryllotalpicola protaetiae]
MIATIVIALASSVAYGFGDFYGGVSSARLRVAPTTLVGYGMAMVTGAVALLFAGGHWSPGAVLWGGLAGLAALAGALSFYAAMVAGPISLATPVVGTVESAVPVIVAVVIGQRMSGLTWLAIVLAVAGGALVSLRFGAGERTNLRAGLFAVAGGVMFGCSILALNRAPHDAGLIPAVFEGAVGFVVMAVLLSAARLFAPLGRGLRFFDAGADASVLVARRGLSLVLPALVSGVLLGIGNTLLVVALRGGELAVVTVLTDLYPVTTVLLAWLIARERLSPVQLLGVALAVGASALFAVA